VREAGQGGPVQTRDKAQRLGLISPEKARALRVEGQKARDALLSGNSPFNRWADWRPDPEWPVPVLPEGWDVL